MKLLKLLSFQASPHSRLRKLTIVPEDADESEKLKARMSNLENIAGMREALTDIRNISYFLQSFSRNRNERKTKSAVHERLEKYSSKERAVLAIAAFASSIAELSMLVKERDHPISKFKNIVQRYSLKLDFNALRSSGLIKAMKEVARVRKINRVQVISL
ncbi:hypothetical protein F3Y22_tig00110076pilonHSYRG00111 [Hibiscus syriacus]|uniref:Uncharacterized protein n=1 Tax=Hibiscus syriacus TaxID=106335 RepID=A0A6A3BIY2_HIBSY|nr:hypothetical protein F3Y22_tig00110076pilonHSYRG00111 [Hibiscus syriacus]